MPPAIESQMLRGVSSRKRNLLENGCMTTNPSTASSETNVTTDIVSRYPLLSYLETDLRVSEKTLPLAILLNRGHHLRALLVVTTQYQVRYC